MEIKVISSLLFFVMFKGMDSSVRRGDAVVFHDDFYWTYGDWSDCSESCAGGIQKKNPICRSMSDDKRIASQELCNPESRPIEETQECNKEPCQPQWYTGQWSTCDKSCGGGNRSRFVGCRRRIYSSSFVILKNSVCPGEMPVRTESCNSVSCEPAKWVAYSWSQCRCSRSVKKRKVWCMSNEGEKLRSGKCSGQSKPTKKVKCAKSECIPLWHSGRWGRCVKECGRTIQRRRVYCKNRTRTYTCNQRIRPSNTQPCKIQAEGEDP